MNRMFHQFLQKFSRGSSPLNNQNEAWKRRISRESHEHQRELNLSLDQLLVSAIDSETTGFYPEAGNEILSIAAYRWQGESWGDSYHSYVQIVGQIPAPISELTGIYPQDLLEAPLVQEVLPAFLDYIGKSVIIGYYIGHDIRFINYYLSKYFHRRIENRVLEVGKVVALLYPEWKNASFDEVCTYFQISNPHRHSASGDAHAVAELWEKLVILLKAQGIENLMGLYKELVKQPHL